MKIRWTLRTFFVTFTLLCLWLGSIAHTATEQRRTVEWIKDRGGTCRYGYEFKSTPKNIAKPRGPKWLRDLIGIDFFERVKLVELHDRSVTNVGRLSTLPHLKSVWLGDTKVVDVSPLSRCWELESLDLCNTNVADLEPISGLPCLRHLGLRATNVVDIGPLSKTRSLESLNLQLTYVTDLTPLEPLSLRSLQLAYSEVADISPLARISELNSIGLTDTNVSEADYLWLQEQLTECNVSWQERPEAAN